MDLYDFKKTPFSYAHKQLLKRMRFAFSKSMRIKQKLHEHKEKFRFFDEDKTKLYSKNGIKDSDSVSKTEFQKKNKSSGTRQNSQRFENNML